MEVQPNLNRTVTKQKLYIIFSIGRIYSHIQDWECCDLLSSPTKFAGGDNYWVEYNLAFENLIGSHQQGSDINKMG